MRREFVIVAIHGEGDRVTVNALQAHRNLINKSLEIPDEPPDVLVVMHDVKDAQQRLELALRTWEEVDEWKEIAGFDYAKRHWKSGAVVQVSIGG